MKKIFLSFILLVLVCGVFANNQKSTMKPALGAGYGKHFQGSFIATDQKNYFCIRKYIKQAFSLSPNEYYSETAFLYGRALDLSLAFRGFAALSAGISYNRYGIEDKIEGTIQNKTSFGLPLEINLVNGISPYFAVGFNYTLNLNKIKNNSSYFFCIYLGDFALESIQHN